MIWGSEDPMRLAILGLVICALSFGQNPTATRITALNAEKHKFATTELTASDKHLSDGDRKALRQLIEAARFLDPLYLRQVWAGNLATQERVQKDRSKLGKLCRELFRQNAGPWIRLTEQAFLENVPPHKPPGAGFYPEDLTKKEFEDWLGTLAPGAQEKAKGFFSVIHRTPAGALQVIPYSVAYKEYLTPAAAALRKAADLTDNASLKRFLTSRADAFFSDDYYASDVAWMDLDAPIDVTFGPYETYEDAFLGQKAAFEAYITIRNDAETAKLKKMESKMQELENNLPMDPSFRNPKVGAAAPIRVVDLVFSSGDGRRGVMTAAFNLPNDDKVVKEKGSKRVMLRNVQLAKFEKVLKPIAKTVLAAADLRYIDFDAFFQHITMHELVHGIGPHGSREKLQELYSAIEEAKADMGGLWALRYLVDKNEMDARLKDTVYTTFLASAFRSIRFGLNEAHGKAVAMQLNYLIDEKAILVDERTAKFRVDPAKIAQAVEKLTRTLLTIEATGDRASADALLKKYGVIRPVVKKALDKMGAIPVDIDPRFKLAGE